MVSLCHVVQWCGYDASSIVCTSCNERQEMFQTSTSVVAQTLTHFGSVSRTHIQQSRSALHTQVHDTALILSHSYTQDAISSAITSRSHPCACNHVGCALRGRLAAESRAVCQHTPGGGIDGCRVLRPVSAAPRVPHRHAHARRAHVWPCITQVGGLPRVYTRDKLLSLVRTQGFYTPFEIFFHTSVSHMIKRVRFQTMHIRNIDALVSGINRGLIA